MFRIDDPSAVTALPAPEPAGTEGYFTEGNPSTGVPATLVRGSWLNMIQEELRAVIVAAGLTPSKTTYNQLLTALSSAGVFQTQPLGDNSTKPATTAFLMNAFAKSLAASGYQKLPSGLILQWGITTIAASSNLTVTLPIAFPTAALVPVASGYGSSFSPGATPNFGATFNGSLSQITLQNMYSASNASIAWLALGY